MKNSNNKKREAILHFTGLVFFISNLFFPHNVLNGSCRLPADYEDVLKVLFIANSKGKSRK